MKNFNYLLLLMGLAIVAACSEQSLTPETENGMGDTAKPSLQARTTQDPIYPEYTTEFLAPFRDNFSDETLPPAHFRFVDGLSRQPLANLQFVIRNMATNQVVFSPRTDGDGFWFDEDFASDPGQGSYVVIAKQQRFEVNFAGDANAPLIREFALERTNVPNWDIFTNVPASVRESAEVAWLGEELPALTIAFTFGTSGTKEGWEFSVYDPRDRSCKVGENSPFLITDRQSYHQFETRNGFVFLEEDELCGNRAYTLDNRQDQLFDAFCGPDGRTINYQGQPLFVYVRMWCE